MSVELSKADEAQFGFAEEDDEIYVEGDVKPGEKCLYVTSMDGEGVGLVGTLREIRDFVGLMARGLDIEIAKEQEYGETGYELKTGHTKDVTVQMGQFSDVEYDADGNPIQKETGL